MSGEPGLLSIVIPVHNGAEVLGGTLDSVARQEGVNCEAIVVDDCSSDATLEVAQGWAARHPEIPLRLIPKERRELTLRARLDGIEAAAGGDLMFIDADDELIRPGSLARILEIKRGGGFEIAHFRSQFMGEASGEAVWNAPMSPEPLRGWQVFEAYAGTFFPPVLAWGKIYSTSLLRKAAIWAQKLEIKRLEDVFFVSLIMLFASSYCPVDEFAYRYGISTHWPMEKYAARAQDLLKMRPFFQELLPREGAPEESRIAFMDFLERRLLFNLNGFCAELADNLERGASRGEILARLEPCLGDPAWSQALLLALAASATKSSAKAGKMAEGLEEYENL